MHADNIKRRSAKLVRLAAAASIGGGLLVLAGWLFDIPVLKSGLPGFVEMKANTALGFILAGLALALMNKRPLQSSGLQAEPNFNQRGLSWPAAACALALLLLGALTLGEYLSGADFGIDQLLFREPAGTVGTLAPGRMAPAAAISYILMGLALLLSGRRRAILVVQGLAGATGMIGLLPLLGYLYGAANLSGIGYYTQLALPTAALFIILSLGLLLLQPAVGFMRTVTDDTQGGWLLRRLAPFTIGVPLALGWLSAQGERLGLFESLMAVAVTTIALMLILTLAVWWFVRALNRLDDSRRQAEARVRASEENLHAALYGIGDGVITTDAAGRVTRMNPAAAQLAGWSEAEALGRPLKDILSIIRADTRSALELSFDHILPAGLRLTQEDHAVLVSRTGAEHPITAIGMPIRLEQDALAGLVLIFHDETAELASQKALRESELNLRHILDSVSFGVLIVGKDKKLRHANRAAVEMTGYASTEEMNGLLCHDNLCPAEVGQCPILDLNQTVDNSERIILTRTGRETPVLKSVTPIVLNGENVLLESFIDITARKQAENQAEAALAETRRLLGEAKQSRQALLSVVEDQKQADAALQASTDFLNNIINAIGDPLFVKDEQHRLIMVNDAECQLTGHARKDVLGKTNHGFFPKEQAAEFRKQDDLVLESGLENINEEQITDAQYRQSQKMEAIGQLAGGVAHDFNNILQVIGGFCDLLLDKTDAQDPKREDILEIKRSARRAADLTHQLLAFSRRQMIIPQVTDLNDLVVKTEKMLTRLLGEDIHLLFEPDPALPRIEADPGQIGQVIMNLAVNARDAMPGGGRLAIRTASIRLQAEDAHNISEARQGSFVCMTVSDTGAGMTEEVQKHLFEPFFSTKGAGKGTGLGLSVIYGIVKQHNGWINVYSQLEQGTTFNIYLPAYAGVRGAELAESPAQPPPRGKGERILLIEDAAEIRAIALRMLAPAGYDVVCAENVQDAWRKFEHAGGQFDLIFSDIVLPDGNGIELASALRDRRPALAVLLSSGYTDDRVRWPMIMEKGFGFIHKPYPAGDLLREIRKLLDDRTVPPPGGAQMG